MNHTISTFLMVLTLAACSSLRKSQTSTNNFPNFSYEGHRGARGLYPENSIIAMKASIDLPKVTTLEMDCHITKDKKVVVFHDDFINPKFVQYKNGKSLNGTDDQGIVYNYTYTELSKFDIGSKYYGDFPQQKKTPTPICLLSDLIDSVEAYAKLKRHAPMFYNIEAKSTPGKDNEFHPDPSEFSELIVKILKEKSIVNRSVIQSFDKRTLQYIHQKYPQIKTSYLIYDTITKDIAPLVKELAFKPFIISPYYKMVTPQFVNQAHQKGIKIIPWTVNEKASIKKLQSLTVDGIISDYPNLY